MGGSCQGTPLAEYLQSSNQNISLSINNAVRKFLCFSWYLLVSDLTSNIEIFLGFPDERDELRRSIECCFTGGL